MKTFPHWRAVGAAMRWARQQGNVTTHRHREHLFLDRTSFDLEWKRSDGHGALVSWRSHCELVDVRAGGPVKDCYMSDWDDAAEILRVLAALDLIPNEIAYAPVERYGRCEVCGRLAQWWPAEAASPGRWVHVHGRDERFPDYADHLAEVAGDRRCTNCAPGYDCESGIYTRPEVTPPPPPPVGPGCVCDRPGNRCLQHGTGR